MTREEAVNELDELTMYVEHAFTEEHKRKSFEAIQMAIKELEKQIPRELTSIRKVKKYDGYDMGYCPICDEPLDNSFYENLKYCFVCGQAIKWE